MKKNSSINLVWFRQDLRLTDNLALYHAARSGQVLPIFILNEEIPEKFKPGSATKIWLHYSLKDLNSSLKDKLNIYQGDPEKIILQLIDKYKIKNVFWNEVYEPWQYKYDLKLQKILNNKNIEVKKYNSSYIWHPTENLKDDGSYYKVFTAYKKKAKNNVPRKSVVKPKDMITLKDVNSIKIEQLRLLPKNKWYKKMIDNSQIGEKAAKDKLEYFTSNLLAGYKAGRDIPKKSQTSKLSMHLHFGEISPIQIYETINSIDLCAIEDDAEHFLSEVIWREFSCYLLYHFKKLSEDNFNLKFDKFPWKKNKKSLLAWQQGKTGYPLVDAGMRELWQTGYMHNRVRMVVASFLVKNLNIHWHCGQSWFWDCLLDADLANNSASWQWVAGCGADAAPYFRIFNPITQGEKFDKEGNYTKKFIPELKDLPSKYLYKPWDAPKNVLEEAKIVLGKDYPFPIVDLVISRNIALNNYKKL